MFGGRYGELSPVPIDEAAGLISFFDSPLCATNGARLVPSICIIR
jgi:preprotein translocase subunit Sec61beta